MKTKKDNRDPPPDLVVVVEQLDRGAEENGEQEPSSEQEKHAVHGEADS